MDKILKKTETLDRWKFLADADYPEHEVVIEIKIVQIIQWLRLTLPSYKKINTQQRQNA